MASLELIYRSAQTNQGLADCVFPFTYYEQTGNIPPALKTNDFAREEISRRSLAEIRTSLLQADRVYFLMNTAAIGDSVIATAYLSAVEEGFRILGINPPKTILTSYFMGRIFNNLFSPQDTPVRATAYEGLRLVKEELENKTMDGKKSVVLDFQGMNWETPSPLLPVSLYGVRVTFAYRLYPVMIIRYTNATHGSGRFARPIEDFFSLSKGSIDDEKAQPKLDLPQDAEEIYHQVISRNSLDSDSEQISMVVEASNIDKKYPLLSWKQVAEAILRSRPDIHINVIYDPRNSFEDNLRSIFLTEESSNIHLVSGNLEELMVFLARQRLVLSNDTGLAHMAAAVAGGPKVMTLFQSRQYTPDIWVSSKRQIPITVAQNSPDSIAQQSLQLI